MRGTRKHTCIEHSKGRAWIELDKESLRHNVEVLRSVLPDTCELMPAVKANAYGHGSVEICQELNLLGVRAFCVASVAEGIELRKARIQGSILVLGYTHPQHFYLLRRYRLTQTVIDREYAQTLEQYKRKLAVHIKVDTGMNRLGESSKDFWNVASLFEYKNLEITGIYTHLSAQSEVFTLKQFSDFLELADQLKDLILLKPLTKASRHVSAIPKTHAQSSYGALSNPSTPFDYARVGIALYGAYQDVDNTGKAEELRPVLSLRARVSTVKAVHKGDFVGYGNAFCAPHAMKIAALSIGYADGIPRSLSCGVGRVLVNGQGAPIVGLVCMDQTIVDVTGIENVRQGDIATVIGKEGDEEITVVDIARQTETITNEVLSRLGERLERFRN